MRTFDVDIQNSHTLLFASTFFCSQHLFFFREFHNCKEQQPKFMAISFLVHMQTVDVTLRTMYEHTLTHPECFNFLCKTCIKKENCEWMQWIFFDKIYAVRCNVIAEKTVFLDCIALDLSHRTSSQFWSFDKIWHVE